MVLRTYSSLLVLISVASGLALAVVACAAVPDKNGQDVANAVAATSASPEVSSPASMVATTQPEAESPKAIVQRVCQSCHDIGVLSQPPHTADEWPAIVQRMRSNGADLTSAQAKLVVTYLQQNYVAKP